MIRFEKKWLLAIKKKRMLPFQKIVVSIFKMVPSILNFVGMKLGNRKHEIRRVKIFLLFQSKTCVAELHLEGE